MRNNSNIYLVNLRGQLVKAFNKEELKLLCSDLGIPFDDLSGNTIESLALDLVSYMDRRGRVDELVQYCSQLRPHLNWKNPPDTLKAAVSAEPPKPSGIRPWVFISSALIVIGILVFIIVKFWPDNGDVTKKNPETTTGAAPTTVTIQPPTTTTIPPPPATTSVSASIPKAPTNLSLKDYVLYWNDNSNNETGFQVERSTSEVFATKETVLVKKDVISFNCSGFSTSYLMSTTLYYRVVAYNDLGSSTSLVLTVPGATMPTYKILPLPGTSSK
jgi:hypothetical protein